MVDQSARPRDKGDDRNYGYAGALCHGCLQRARRETARRICEQRSAGVDPCASYQQCEPLAKVNGSINRDAFASVPNADDRTSRPLRQDRATSCRPGWVSAKRRSGREEVSRAASCRDSDARLSARIDAIVTWANTGAKAIRRSPAIRLPRRFFPLLGAQKSAAGTRIKRLDRIRKQLIEIALSQTLLGLDAAFLRIFP